MALPADRASDQLKALQKADEDRLVKQGNGNSAIAFAKDVKSSMAFQYEWSELVCPTPMCISLLGFCYVAAGSPSASSLSLKDCQPPGGFKHIQYPELRACLYQVADAGRIAFIEADKKMDLISNTSKSLGQYLTRMLQYVSQLPDRDAEMVLGDNLANLQEGSDNCMRYAQDVERKFKGWLDLVCEAHQVVVAKIEKSTTVKQNSEIEIGGVSIAPYLAEKSTKDAQEVAKNMKQTMEQNRELFKRAADAIPTPLEAVGIQLVKSLGQTVTSTIAQGLPAMMNMQSDGRPKTLGQANTNVIDANDAAYRVADQVNIVVTLLSTVLGIGTSNGVNWDYLLSETQRSGSNSLTFIDTVLKHTLDYTKWSQGSASSSLRSTIGQLLEVTKALKAEASKNDIRGPSVSTSVVQEWQKKVTDAKASILSLAATMIAIPGAAPGSSPIIGGKLRMSGQPDVIGANAALQNAQESARLTEAAYKSGQANYATGVDRCNKVNADLTRIKGSLQSLTLQKASLEDIKRILRQCIGTLIQIKSQLSNLVLFFSAFSAIAEHLVKENVKDFMREPEKAQKVTTCGISLLDMSRTDLYTSILVVQGYFSPVQAIANMYREISVQYLNPGLRMSDEMSKSAYEGDRVIRLLTTLNEFTTSAQDAIREKSEQFQQKTTDSLRDRTEIASRSIRLVQASTPAYNAAIEAGTKKVTQAVEEGLAANQNGAVAAGL